MHTTHPNSDVSARARATGAALAAAVLLVAVAVPPVGAAEAPAPPRARIGSGPVFEACPVDRPHRYVDDFGAPRYGGGYHPHAGIDVFARHGTPVRAPFDGRAEASTNWAGGLAVRVFGDRGFVYNAHLSKIGKLGRVKAGDVVGHVGNSGNAVGASPHNHFEWHPRGGPAVNPFLLLRKACRPAPKPKAVERVDPALRIL